MYAQTHTIYSVYYKNIHIPRTSKCCNVLDALNLPDSVKPSTTRVLTPYYVSSPTPYVRHFLGVDSHCKYKLYHPKKQVIFLKMHHTAHEVYEGLFYNVYSTTNITLTHNPPPRLHSLLQQAKHSVFLFHKNQNINKNKLTLYIFSYQTRRIHVGYT